MILIIHLILCVILIILLLAFPGLAHQGTDQGIALFFEALFPYLLPYLILTQWLLRLTSKINRSISKVKLFIQTYLIAALGGFPTGATTIAFLKNNHQINAQEAAILLAICHAPSPLFVIGFVSNDLLHQYAFGWQILFIIHLINIVFLIIFIKQLTKSPSYIHIQPLSTERTISPFSESLKDSAPVLLLVGITIIFFTTIYRILFSLLLSLFPNLSEPAMLLFTTSIEMTNGLMMATSFFENSTLLHILLAAILAVQSLSIHLQVIVLARTANISVKYYAGLRLISFLLVPLIYWLLFN